jgi:hypothetical protein
MRSILRRLRATGAAVQALLLARLTSSTTTQDAQDPHWWLFTILGLIKEDPKRLLQDPKANPYMMPEVPPPPGYEKRLGAQGLVAHFKTFESRADTTHTGLCVTSSYYHAGLGGTLGWRRLERDESQPGSRSSFILIFGKREMAQFFFAPGGACCEVQWFRNTDDPDTALVCEAMRDKEPAV